MIYLLASIFFSTLTVCLFIVFEKKDVDTFQAIVFNYLTCAVIGNVSAPQTIFSGEVWLANWFPFAFILGFLFIIVFNFIAQTAQKLGVSISMVAAKLSVVLPVIAAVILYDEPLNFMKISGILISLLAVYLISKKENAEAHNNNKLLYLPILVFIGSGCIDTLLNYTEQNYIPPFDVVSIVSTIFSVAFIAGSFYLLILMVLKRKIFVARNLVWGIILGLPNYFSMFFLLKTLGQFQGTYIFPLNNIGIVAASTMAGVYIFKEKLSAQNKFGFILAILSILIISISDAFFR